MKIVRFYSDTCKSCEVLDINLQRASIMAEK